MPTAPGMRGTEAPKPSQHGAHGLHATTSHFSKCTLLGWTTRPKPSHDSKQQAQNVHSRSYSTGWGKDHHEGPWDKGTVPMYECLVAQPQQGSELCAHEPASKCNVPYIYESVPSFSGSVGCNKDRHTPKGGDEEEFKRVSVQWGDPRKGSYSLKMLVQTVLLCPTAGGCCSAWLSPEPALQPPSLTTGDLTHVMQGQDPSFRKFQGKDPKATFDEIPPVFSQPHGALKPGALLRRQTQQGAALQR